MTISTDKIEARTSAGSILVGGILFGTIGAGFLYLGILTDDRDMILVGSLSLLPTLLALKILINPIIMFSADHRGVTIGKGLIRHTRRFVPWSKVVSINEGSTTRLGPRRADGSGVQKVVVAAIVVEFDESIDLGTYGYSGAMPNGNRYSIQSKFFGMGTDGADVILGLLELKDKYTKS